MILEAAETGTLTAVEMRRREELLTAAYLRGTGRLIRQDVDWYLEAHAQLMAFANAYAGARERLRDVEDERNRLEVELEDERARYLELSESIDRMVERARAER